jgi:hypothetical protein
MNGFCLDIKYENPCPHYLTYSDKLELDSEAESCTGKEYISLPSDGRDAGYMHSWDYKDPDTR